MRTSAISIPITAIDTNNGTRDGGAAPKQDTVAVEEPLQIRVNRRRVAVTMRTPGHDPQLAAGFLFTEGIIHSADQISSIGHASRRRASPRQADNELVVRLRAGENVDFARRNFYVSSSCGVCGKASVDAVRAQGCRTIEGSLRIPAELLCLLPGRLRQAQATFERTGGLHAAGLFNASGELLRSFEDVGRHNAVDKLIGDCLLNRELPLADGVLVVSGRTSFELVQKAVMAGVPVLAAVGAPSSLAVELALRFHLTLAGFVRDGRCNVYAGADRVISL